MTTTEAVVSLALVVAAGSLAIPGWLLNEPNTERRYQCRLFAWLALLGQFLWWGAHDLAHHAYWGFAVDAVALVWAMNRVSHWWRAVEAIREVKRVLSKRAAGTP